MPPLNASKPKSGCFLSRISYMRVISSEVENENGFRWSIGRDILEAEAIAYNPFRPPMHAGFLSMLDQDDMHRMGAYSAADAKDARGKIIIMEEASRIDDALIKEVILPLAAKGALLGIGTPLNEKTLFSTMLDDTKTFDVLEVTLDSMRVRHV